MRKRVGRVVAEQPDVDLAPFDELLDQYRLTELVEDHLGRHAQFRLVPDDLEAERHGFVLRLDDERVGQLADLRVRCLEHGEVRCGQTMLAQDHLRHDLVEAERMRQGAGCDVRNADHLQDARHVGVPRLSLHAVRDVEDETRPLTLDDARHELLQPVDQILVAFDRDHLMPARLEPGDNPPDGCQPDLLAVRHAEQVDDVAGAAVVDDGNLHEGSSGMPFPRAAIHGIECCAAVASRTRPCAESVGCGLPVEATPAMARQRRSGPHGSRISSGGMVPHRRWPPTVSTPARQQRRARPGSAESGHAAEGGASNRQAS